jgi:hypothetical protein
MRLETLELLTGKHEGNTSRYKNSSYLETEIRKIAVLDQSKQIVCEIPSPK